MDSAIAPRLAGGLVLVNVAGTIGSGVAWAVIGGSSALIVYALTFGLTVIGVFGGMNAMRDRAAQCRSCKTVVSGGSVCQECGGRTAPSGRFGGMPAMPMLNASLAVRSSSANATKI